MLTETPSYRHGCRTLGDLPQIVDPLQRTQIRDVTALIRIESGYYDEPCFPVVRYLELTLPQAWPDVELSVVPDTEFRRDDYAVTDVQTGVITVPESVYLEAVDGVGRSRFTLAHEYGHLILHSVKPRESRPELPGRRYNPSFDPEWQADTFAGELLCPIHLTVRMSGWREIMDRCQVSDKAAQKAWDHVLTIRKSA